jgi:AraC-like DNA-binding protein
MGVSLGLFLSFFLIKKSASNIKANKYQGLLLLSLSLCILEQFLNLTGLIVKVLPITNSTEPLNFTIGPFLYLFIKRSIDESDSKNEWIHFIIFFLYLGYICFDFIQPNDFKYNEYVSSIHPDWPLLKVRTIISYDPLGIKKHLNLLTSAHVLFYISISIRKLMKKAGQVGESIFRTNNNILKSLRNMNFHILIIIMIFIIVKTNFRGDTDDYFIGIYVSLLAIITTYRVMNDSSYFERSTTFLDIPVGKYRNSSLTETGKMKILDNIFLELETRHYFSDNLASLSELAKKIGESPHHVSQVINEKLNESFFELLATYRVEEAKRILSDKKNDKLTVEEISEMVGYNSKTAFNNAFKKLTDKTPSEFRKSINH